MNNVDTILASALAALPDLGSDAALPDSLQVFPPGKGVKFTLQDYPGQEFEMDVDASVADKANADLQALMARATAGLGSQPFADKNHEDAEAMFHPVKYYWAGDDPVTGGVRVVPDWTPFGAQLVRAKAFKYFSGNFLFSKSRKKFMGLLNENIGGLVNRPGFASQAAFARAEVSRPALPETTTTTETPMTKDEVQQIGAALAAALKPLADRVAALEGRASTVEGHLGAATLTPKAVSDFANVVNAKAKAGGDYEKALREATYENPEAAGYYISAMRRGRGSVMRQSVIGGE